MKALQKRSMDFINIATIKHLNIFFYRLRWSKSKPNSSKQGLWFKRTNLKQQTNIFQKDATLFCQTIATSLLSKGLSGSTTKVTK